jgi:hypothetical protein
MDFEGLFNVDMGELSNLDAPSHANQIEEDTTDQSQWQQQDDLNLDDENTATGGLSDETRTKLDECQSDLDRLNSEKANLNVRLAEMNNPALKVKILFEKQENKIFSSRHFYSQELIPFKRKSNEHKRRLVFCLFMILSLIFFFFLV